MTAGTSNPSPATSTDYISIVIHALQQIDPRDPLSGGLLPYLYQPPPGLSERVEELFQAFADRPTKADEIRVGKMMEELACLIFRQLSGSIVEPCQSAAGPQFDAVVRGHNEAWVTLTKMLSLGDTGRSILVEAKATNDKVEDKHFARMIAAMDNNLHGSVGLGVFFTLNGATGFPDSSTQGTRLRKLSDCKLAQALYRSRSKNFIVVFDRRDIEALARGENLVSMLREKIADVDIQSGLAVGPLGSDSHTAASLPAPRGGSLDPVV